MLYFISCIVRLIFFIWAKDEGSSELLLQQGFQIHFDVETYRFCPHCRIGLHMIILILAACLCARTLFVAASFIFRSYSFLACAEIIECSNTHRSFCFPANQALNIETSFHSDELAPIEFRLSNCFFKVRMCVYFFQFKCLRFKAYRWLPNSTNVPCMFDHILQLRIPSVD